MRHTYRTTLGKHWNEGARLAWLAKESGGLSNAALAARVGCSAGSVCRILYGIQKPGRMAAARFEAALGIPLEAWDAAPTESFVLPAAREPAESGTALPDTLDDADPVPTGTDHG